MPNFEAALIKDLGNSFEREIPELARLLRRRCPDATAISKPCWRSILYAPSWTLRGGTREILRGIIAADWA